LGSLFNETFVLSSGDVTDGIVNTMITNGTATTVPLIFTSDTPGNVGALLDNVSLTPAMLPDLIVGGPFLPPGISSPR
jgi:hypothetical protein